MLPPETNICRLSACCWAMGFYQTFLAFSRTGIVVKPLCLDALMGINSKPRLVLRI